MEPTSVASFCTQMLEGCLNIPALFRRNIRQEGSTISTRFAWLLELYFNTVCSYLPVSWIIDLFKRIQKTNLNSERANFCLVNWWETGVLNRSYQTISH